MEEIKSKIDELETGINTIEINCIEKLNFGNVPKNNWDDVLKLLLRRSRLIEALNALEETKRIIEDNK